MKKLSIILLVTAGLFQSAQSQVLEDKIIILEAQRSVLRLELNYNTKIVEEALNDKLSKLGVKTKSSKGFTTASGAKLLEVSPDLLDYYFKIEKIDKNRSKLFVGISKGYSNFIDPTTNADLWQSALKFVGSMTEYTSNYQAANNAKAMEKEIATAQKNFDKKSKALKKQQEELEKSQKELENKRMDLEKTRNSLKN